MYERQESIVDSNQRRRDESINESGIIFSNRDLEDEREIDYRNEQNELRRQGLRSPL